LGGDGNVKEKTLNGTAHSVQNGHFASTTIKTTTKMDTRTKTNTTTLREKLPFLLLQVSIFQTLAGPIGFSALRHISYPTMVLGKVSSPHLLPSPINLFWTGDGPSYSGSKSGQRRKTWKSDEGKKGQDGRDQTSGSSQIMEKWGIITELSGSEFGESEYQDILSRYHMRLSGERANFQSCKLIPVLLLNVILYRRRFSPHKYLVVSLVTVGISMFMFFGPAKKKGGEDSAWGLGLLMIKYVYFFLPLLTPPILLSTPSLASDTFPHFSSLVH